MERPPDISLILLHQRPQPALQGSMNLEGLFFLELYSSLDFALAGGGNIGPENRVGLWMPIFTVPLILL
jgi:hypothetical protein